MADPRLPRAKQAAAEMAFRRDVLVDYASGVHRYDRASVVRGDAVTDEITHNLTVVREALEAEGLGVHVKLIDTAIEDVAKLRERLAGARKALAPFALIADIDAKGKDGLESVYVMVAAGRLHDARRFLSLTDVTEIQVQPGRWSFATVSTASSFNFCLPKGRAVSDRMTRICLPGVFGSGIADWGKKTVPEMIAMIRRYAEHEKAVAEAILAASDEQFLVETYIGVHVMRNKVVLQISALKTAQGKSDGSSSRS